MKLFVSTCELVSLLMLSGCALDIVQPIPPNAIPLTAIYETDPVSSKGDSADDPAIWINSGEIEKSLVIGTDKNFGLEVYDLKGNLVQRIAAGRTNNVDLRYIQDSTTWSAIAAASNRTNNTISLFLIDHFGELQWLENSEILTGLSEPYGLCMYADALGIQVFVNDTDGSYQQWLLQGTSLLNPSAPEISAELVREFSVSSQPEGCVADDYHQRLFLGVEAMGVNTIAASASESASLTSVAKVDGVILAADVEGMSLYLQGDSSGYLIVSSQGNYSYSLYDRLPPHAYRGSFYVNEGETVDGAQETDGLSVSSKLRTADFPNGLLVVQDGFNTSPNAAQNFKYISWLEVISGLELD